MQPDNTAAAELGIKACSMLVACNGQAHNAPLFLSAVFISNKGREHRGIPRAWPPPYQCSGSGVMGASPPFVDVSRAGGAEAVRGGPVPQGGPGGMPVGGLFGLAQALGRIGVRLQLPGH